MGHPTRKGWFNLSGVEFPMHRNLLALVVSGMFAAPAISQPPQPNYGSNGFLEAAATGLVTSTAQFGANIVSQTLESALRRSRDAARTDSKPIRNRQRVSIHDLYQSISVLLCRGFEKDLFERDGEHVHRHRIERPRFVDKGFLQRTPNSNSVVPGAS